MDNELRQVLLDGFYVDDFMGGSNSDSGEVELALKVSAAMEAAGTKLRKWISNAPSVIVKLKEQGLEMQPEVETGL